MWLCFCPLLVLDMALQLAYFISRYLAARKGRGTLVLFSGRTAPRWMHVPSVIYPVPHWELFPEFLYYKQGYTKQLWIHIVLHIGKILKRINSRRQVVLWNTTGITKFFEGVWSKCPHYPKCTHTDAAYTYNSEKVGLSFLLNYCVLCTKLALNHSDSTIIKK